MEGLAALGFVWVMAGCAAAYMAAGMGRSAVTWGVCAFLFPPLIVVLWLIGSPPEPERRTPCPFCAELVMVAAVKCPHCHSVIGHP